MLTCRRQRLTCQFAFLISQTWQFKEPNSSQGSVASYGRCAGILNNHYCKFTSESSSGKILKIKIWQIHGHEFGAAFFGPRYITRNHTSDDSLEHSTAPVVYSNSRHITTPAPQHSSFYRPDALPAVQPTASKHWRQKVVQRTYVVFYSSVACYSSVAFNSI